MINIPFFILIAISLLTLGESISRHGEQKKFINHNAWDMLISIIIYIGLTFWAIKIGKFTW